MTVTEAIIKVSQLYVGGYLSKKEYEVIITALELQRKIHGDSYGTN